MAAPSYFLRLDGIQGESADTGHAGWIQVDSLHWSDPGQQGSPPTQRGLSIVKPLDAASPALFLACTQGTHLASGDLAVTVQSNSIQAYRLSNVLVSSYLPAGLNGGAPTEQVVLRALVTQEDGGPVTTPCLKGDVNADGRIDVSDVLLSLRMAVTTRTTPQTCAGFAADINDDGRIGVDDVFRILRHVLLGEPLTT
ncbi:MAG TPA: type VI secretion system tube protein Hcp [Armatimonadota bacterium]|jgi:type VI protein secretion system component Hcp